MKNLSYDQAMKLVKSYNAKLIDTQLYHEYLREHLTGSINIPVEEINEKAHKYLKDKSEIIIVYCLSGVRSIAACDMLQRLGYINVYNIQNGIENYR